MPLTHPSLVGETPTAPMPRELLEEPTANLRSTKNTAVIATVRTDGLSVATPVRYSSLGFEVFYISWSASVKPCNLRRDPRVSLGVVAPSPGPSSSRDAQLLGVARYAPRQIWQSTPS